MADTYPILDLSSPPTFEVVMPWQDVTFASLAEVTDCLDYLEHQEVQEHKVVLVGDEFHVQWR